MMLNRLCSRRCVLLPEKRLRRLFQPLSIAERFHASYPSQTPSFRPKAIQTQIPSLDLPGDALIDLPKNFDPALSEEKIYQWWEENGFFEPNDSSDDVFVVPMPPPNVTGRLHMGHAMFVALQDVMTRFARMRGKSALWLPGTDHAGIATQMVVEKMLREQGITRIDLGREKFEEAVWEWKSKYGGFITNQLRRLGASCDWSRERFTLDPTLSIAVNEAFVRLHEKGYIYRGSYLVNWSPSLQTAVSDLEVEYSEEQGTLYFFKYPLADEEGFIPVATTRPETILGDTAVAVHPEDERYRHLIGKQCTVPILGRCIDIVGDSYVDKDFGTGALKITPGHDPNDYEIGQRRNLDLINIFNKDATVNENGGKYEGMDRFEVRKALWKDMEAEGLILKTEKYLMRVPRSQRGGEVIEPMISEQWFVKMEDLAKPALDAVRSGTIKMTPAHFKQIFDNWLENIKDWCISRQLWWGHRIPVWYVNTPSSKDYVVARSHSEALSLAREQFGSDVELFQDPDVLDTWFSSALWPFSTLGWPDVSHADYRKFYPTQILETGHDILFFWVARMIMMGIEFTGTPPFGLVYLHGLVRDERGRKMSKSLGNVVDPIDLMETYGADALRFAMVTGVATGQDLNLNLEKLTSAKHFTNKLWNIGKFIGMNLPSDSVALEELAKVDFSESLQDLPLMEKWIVSRLHQLIHRVTDLQERLDLSEAGRELYEFIWFDFADWYVEAAKTRLGENADPLRKRQTQSVLVYGLDRILKLIHPFMPFISERLWQALPHEGFSLIVASWPEKENVVDLDSLKDFESLRSVVRSVRNARAEYNVEQTQRIPGTVVVRRRDLLERLEAESEVVVSLSKMKSGEVRFVTELEKETEEKITLIVEKDIEVVLPMSGLFDPAKELERLQKQRMKTEKELEGLEKRLQNESFIQKAPENVVEEVRTKAEQTKAQLSQIDEKIERLSS